MRIARPFGSRIPYTSLGVGKISFDNFVLKILSEGDYLISWSSVFHSEKQSGQKLALNLALLALICPITFALRKEYIACGNFGIGYLV